ncbi:MAG: zinc-ribbon domain-containing protein [Clostridia bacterium]|jgi:RNA polymerase subunit RPABC4/transcription elongation factor Spt4|nr:zinc-ribbon domain-containing protein [Clostridia bacterium]
MEFLNKIGKKVSETYDATAEKTSRLAKEAKLKMKINENKSDIKQLYIEIGEKVYQKHVREENIDIKTELEEQCTKIDVLSSEIETCLNSILELKQRKQCPACHTEIDLDSIFCPKCGKEQPKMEAKDAEEIIVDLENAEVVPENETEKEIVEEKVTGENE